MVGLRKVTRALVGSSLLLGGFAFVAQPASADHLACGATVTQNVTLDSDIGPCAGDGLVVATSNVTINLNGFRIFADNGAGDNAGIRIRPGAAGLTTGVRVIRGTVEGFDAGIAIFGGGNNLVRNMTIQNNINDQIPTVPAGPNPCDLGDGIAMQNSSDNDIINNRLVNNGPYGGITAIENSDRNYIAGNTLADHNLRGRPGGGCGNANQNEGVRIEGPGSDDNIVENNTVTNSGLAGIGLHGYVCGDADPALNTAPNTGSIVRGNRVSNGEQNGISFLQQGPARVVCPAFQATIARNTSSNNASNGLFVARNSSNNEIRDNVFNNNGNNGIRLNDFTIGNNFTNVGPTVLDVVTPDRAPFVETTDGGVTGDFRVLSGSGSGDVTAELVPIDIVFTEDGGVNTNPQDTSTSGCEQADYDAAGFQPGDIALIQRGTCTFVAKINLAIANGASAIVLFNEGQAGRTSAAFGSSGPVLIPVVSTTFAVGAELTDLADAGTVTINVVTNTTNEPVTTPAPFDNRIVRNRATGNVVFDAYDGTLDPPCDNNIWNANTFGTVNQPCVANGGTGVVPPPPPPAP